MLSPEFAGHYEAPLRVYRDTGLGEVADSFIVSLYEEAERLSPILECNEDMKELTPDQKHAHESATVCWLCLDPFVADDKEKIKCHDHCHYS